MKKILYAIALLLTVGLFISCGDDNEDPIEYTMTVASVERIMFIADHHDPYYVKYEGENTWKNHSYIQNFTHTEGYEYVIRVRRDYDKSKEGMIGGSPYSYHLLEEISKTKKDSENIPSQSGWINIASKGTGDPNLPYYKLSIYTGDWEKIAPIEGFEYEEGYEYALEVSCKYNGVSAPQKYTYTYLKTHRKEKIDTVGLPE